MTSNILRIVLAATLWLASQQALASENFFFSIGDLPGGTFLSTAHGVSDDGLVVTGSSSTGTTGDAVLWTSEDGLMSIAPNGAGEAISGDGSTVVGHVFNELEGATEPFVWTAAGLTRLGSPPGGSLSDNGFASDVSANGSVVVGTTTFEGAGRQAFRWTADSGFSQLDGLSNAGQASEGAAVSADGTVIAGTLLGPPIEAFRWTAADGVERLGDLPGGNTSSIATAISASGGVVVGTSSTADTPVQAFRWDTETGIESLGSLTDGLTHTTPFAATGNGEAIIGRNDSFSVGDELSGVHAFVWTNAFGIEPLQEVLEDRFGLSEELEGWTLSSALDISSDGRFLVGEGINPSGDAEGWLVRLSQPIFVPEPASISLVIGMVLGGIARRKRLRFCDKRLSETLA